MPVLALEKWGRCGAGIDRLATGARCVYHLTRAASPIGGNMSKQNHDLQVPSTVLDVTNQLSRRQWIGGAATAAVMAGAGAVPLLAADNDAATPAAASASGKPKGRIQQSACRWCYSKVELDTL